MNEQEAKKWCAVLAESEVGDVITINGLSIGVYLPKDTKELCSHCIWFGVDRCILSKWCDYVIPCSAMNNAIGKPLVFKKL